jgi:hypothetical protein
MRFSSHLKKVVTAGVTAAVLATGLSFAAAHLASAGPAPGMCSTNTTRGTIPANYAVDACFDGSTVYLRNNLTVALTVDVTGDTGNPSRSESDYGLAADATRLTSGDPFILLPGDTLRIPIGSGAASVRPVVSKKSGFYALATTAATFVPGDTAAVVQAFTGMITELDADFGQYNDCLVGKNWVEQLACYALLDRNVGFAVSRAAVNGLAKGVLAALLAGDTFTKWAGVQVPNLTSVLAGPAFTISAVSPAGSPPPPSSSTTQPTPTPTSGGGAGAPSGSGSVSLAQGPTAPSGYRYTVGLTGFPSNSVVSVTCYDTVSPGGFFTFNLTTDSAGSASTQNECYSADGPDHWVVAGGIESNHVTWGGGLTAPAATAPPTTGAPVTQSPATSPTITAAPATVAPPVTAPLATESPGTTSAPPTASPSGGPPIADVVAGQVGDTSYQVSWANPNDPTIAGWIITDNVLSGSSQSAGAPDPDPTASSELVDTSQFEPQFEPLPGQVWQICVTPFGQGLVDGNYPEIPGRMGCSPPFTWQVMQS